MPISVFPTPAAAAADPSDFALEVPRGNITGVSSDNISGRSTNLDNDVDTDVWDRANATDDQDIWVAPTAARIHQIVSTSASDDGSPAGVGARTIEVAGLTGWGTAEVTETITMNGVTNVPTVNSYVIIHRLEVLTKGATDTNVGVITATADTDGTVTAQINAGFGKTQMAIYGVPSTQKLFMTNVYGTIESVRSGKEILVKILANPEPDTELINFNTEFTFSIGGNGTTAYQNSFNPYIPLPGPIIVKIQGIADANNMEASAGFDFFLVNN